MADYEGMDKVAESEFAALKAKLIPDVEKNLEANRKDIEEMLSLEILKRYYFQKGQVQYSLRNDKDLRIAIELLKDTEKYNKILSVK